MEQKGYFHKVNESDLCDTLKLCSVRKNKEDQTMIAIKHSDGKIEEKIAEDIIHLDEFNGNPIKRVYSSGHVFLNEKKDHVYLITVQKYGKTQHQFTGGSPKEEFLQKATYKKNGKVKFHLDIVEMNAEIRTQKRASVKVVDNYNRIPTIDWVMMEQEDKSWNLVCLMHYLVKEYEGIITPQIGVENVVGGGWFPITDLDPTKKIAPNAEVVVKSMLQMPEVTNETENKSLIKRSNKVKLLNIGRYRRMIRNFCLSIKSLLTVN